MKFVSTRNNKKIFGFKDVSLQGLSKDGGLYLPLEWNLDNFKYSKKDINFENISYEVIKNFIGNDLSQNQLKEIIKSSYSNFSNKEITPLRKIESNHWLLELFHGPTLAFKDVALQFLGNLFNFFLQQNNNNLNIIGATSGDTGSAAIEAVKKNKNINIFILHPLNRVSNFQRRQMTTVKSSNVFNIAVKGTFDDCQDIVKRLFKDRDSKGKKFASINSINWSRIMAQVTYYIFAYSKLNSIFENKKIAFSVPTGNFGDAYAGYIAKSKFNIPIKKIIVATNENDILYRFFRTGEYKKSSVKATNSPSMDIQVASNFERLLYDLLSQNSSKVSEAMTEFNINNNFFIKHKDKNKILNSFTSYSISEKSTLEVIKSVYKKYKIILDPHTAVGFAASNEYLKNNRQDIVISLATAHPAKFSEAVLNAINKSPELPSVYKNIFDLEEKFKLIDNNYEKIKGYIFKNSLI
ncbi:MAG: Threonine synthase [Alphaproteobacteria bacterium MarineAlpha9_Bin4]|nr:threonine synthase [Pelagibacterales bacterium]PPR26189.1 MAG: Threonine synthase [Alphaproteobacteria bacterium MarineAlpha9_Bin4]